MIGFLTFTFLVTFASAEDTLRQERMPKEVKKEINSPMAKSRRAYAQAKAACVKESKGHLKGKKLTECIVNYQKEIK